MKKGIAVLLVLLILGTVGYLVITNLDTSGLNRKPPVTVKGYYGSEKEDYLNDPRVIDILKKKYGITLDLRKSGSMEMAGLSTEGIDFFWPSSEIPVSRIEALHKGEIKKSASIGYSPMIVASWEPIKALLEKNGLIRQEGALSILDIGKLIQLTISEKKWSDLQGASSLYRSNKTVLVKTTDPSQSNSGLLYLAISSGLLNGNQVITADKIPTVIPSVKKLFDLQGFKSHTSALPWEDYLNKGRGDTPLVWVYEAQFINDVAANGFQRGGDRLTPLYPEPTIWSNHIYISFTENGNRLLDLLLNDEELQKIFNEHGFRNNYKNGEYFLSYFKEKNVIVPATLDQIADIPTYENMQMMLDRIK
ncbi:MAG: substrate-binding domain-containing protein, partial [Thermicanus sp.]|nr:substrate-binding domain-containing protein [Thermicanus sp.]